MYIGKYSGLQQFGLPEYSSSFGWQTTFMPLEFFKKHAQLNGFPEPEKIDTLRVPSISSLPTDAAGIRKYQSQLVRFDGVKFVNGGKETLRLLPDHRVAEPHRRQFNHRRAHKRILKLLLRDRFRRARFQWLVSSATSTTHGSSRSAASATASMRSKSAHRTILSMWQKPSASATRTTPAHFG